MHSMSPGSFTFDKLVGGGVIHPAKSEGDARYVSEDPFIHSFNIVPYNLDSNLYYFI